jgi:hypothetical protein
VDVHDSIAMLRKTPHPVRSLYAGLGTSLLAVVPTALVYMPTYEAARYVVSPDPGGGAGGVGTRGEGASVLVVPPQLRAPLAGVATGLACATVRVPLAVVKARIQLGVYASLRDGYAKTLRTVRSRDAGGGGRAALRDLYSGFGATAALDIATAVILFASLESLHQMFKDGRASGGDALSSSGRGSGGGSSGGSSGGGGAENAVVGFMASAISTVATEPIDVVRTRLMGQKRLGQAAEKGGRVGGGGSGSKGVGGGGSGSGGGGSGGGSRNSGSSFSSSVVSHHGAARLQGTFGHSLGHKQGNFGYRGLVHGLREAIRAEGIASLYRGLLPRLILKSVGGSLWYTTYHSVKGAMLAPSPSPY